MTTVRRGRDFLMVPGPTPVPERILNAMHRQPVDFSGPDFVALCDRLFEEVKQVFETEHAVFLYTANGHGAWEAALANTLSPGDAVLIPEVGQFSEGWRDMAQALGVEARTIPNDWRRPIDPNRVEEALRADADGAIKAVLMVHTDTAASVTSDVAAVRRAIDASGRDPLFMVDTIASLGTTEYRMDAWGVDVTVAASQKGLMLPPGLAMVAANEKAKRVGLQAKTPRRYWDWIEREKGQHYQRFCGTAPELMIFGLDEALAMLREETLAGAVQRHGRLARAVRAAVEAWSAGGVLSFNALEPASRADSVTTVLVPEGFDPESVRRLARESFGVSISGGLGRFQGKAFRIGHMGDINEPMVLGGLAALETAMRRLGVSIGSGALDAAIESLAQDPLESVRAAE
ncbi:MAG: aminotransferase class V-fold PLP-dependent enzyme [Marivibrio sp.]|uniref:pyridoxal-phosphate-dependent aminotransferase family protein n=1 Tax=Marivibrio sp. TaxID=2039719 RepID=UPI0032F055C4